jgi:hypothetical protein
MAYAKGTRFIKIPVSHEEWVEIQRRAKAQGRSAANYGRMVLLDGKINKKPNEDPEHDHPTRPTAVPRMGEADERRTAAR